MGRTPAKSIILPSAYQPASRPGPASRNGSEGSWSNAVGDGTMRERRGLRWLGLPACRSAGTGPGAGPRQPDVPVCRILPPGIRNRSSHRGAPAATASASRFCDTIGDPRPIVVDGPGDLAIVRRERAPLYVEGGLLHHRASGGASPSLRKPWPWPDRPGRAPAYATDREPAGSAWARPIVREARPGRKIGSGSARGESPGPLSPAAPGGRDLECAQMCYKSGRRRRRGRNPFATNRGPRT